MKIKFRIITKHFPFYNKTKLYNKKFLKKNKIRAILLKFIQIIKDKKFSQKKSISVKKIRFHIFNL